VFASGFPADATKQRDSDAMGLHERPFQVDRPMTHRTFDMVAGTAGTLKV
jgi:hypothetical protein